MNELRHLYDYHPELWAMLRELQDVPSTCRRKFTRDYTIHEIETMFELEDAQIKLDV